MKQFTTKKADTLLEDLKIYQNLDSDNENNNNNNNDNMIVSAKKNILEKKRCEFSQRLLLVNNVWIGLLIDIRSPVVCFFLRSPTLVLVHDNFIVHVRVIDPLFVFE